MTTNVAGTSGTNHNTSVYDLQRRCFIAEAPGHPFVLANDGTLATQTQTNALSVWALEPTRQIGVFSSEWSIAESTHFVFSSDSVDAPQNAILRFGRLQI
jgi:hypothetical protein